MDCKHAKADEVRQIALRLAELISGQPTDASVAAILDVLTDVCLMNPRLTPALFAQAMTRAIALKEAAGWGEQLRALTRTEGASPVTHWPLVEDASKGGS